eukprot:747002-Rhodomonas_salina.4
MCSRPILRGGPRSRCGHGPGRSLSSAWTSPLSFSRTWCVVASALLGCVLCFPASYACAWPPVSPSCTLPPSRCADLSDPTRNRSQVLRDGALMPSELPTPPPSDTFWSSGGYDLIVDDASHFPPYQLKTVSDIPCEHPAYLATSLRLSVCPRPPQIFSLIRLLPALRPGAFYIIEDLDTSYYDGKPLTLFDLPIVGAGVGKPPPGIIPLVCSVIPLGIRSKVSCLLSKVLHADGLV